MVLSPLIEGLTYCYADFNDTQSLEQQRETF